MAARFRVSSSTLWSDTAGWSLTTGGAGGQAVPTSSDDVTFDANSTVDVTLDTPTAKVCKTLTCTNYTHILTFNVTLTCTPATGNTIALGASMSFAGSSALIISGASAGTTTFTPNGLTVTVPLTLNGVGSNSTTFTLSGTLTVSGLLTIGSAGGSPTTTINSNSISASGGITLFTNCATAGTTTITASGGTIQMSGGAGFAGTSGFGNAITFGGSLTWSGDVWIKANLTYSSGTITTTSSTLTLNSTALTLNVASVTWNNFTVRGGSNITFTLSGDVNASGNLLYVLTAGAPTLTFNSNNINFGGSLTIPTSLTAAGTTVLVPNGIGTWSGGGVLKNSLTINTSGTFTISGTVTYNTGTLTYTAGTFAGTSTPILSITTSTSFDFNGVTVPASFSCTVAGSALTLKSDMILDGTRTLTLNGTNASPITLVSNVGGTLRKLTVLSGIIEDVIYCNPTDIDSRDGVPVYYAKGTLSNTFNWIGTNPGTAKKGQIVLGGTPYSVAGIGSQVFGG